MEWYYAVGDKQMGPVDEAEFKRLAAEGTIRPDTLVWNTSMEGWSPYRTVSAAASAAQTESPVADTGVDESTAPSGSPTVVCRECGKLFHQEDVVRIDNAFVCGDCKPVFLQRLQEGAGSFGGGGGTQSQEELLAGDYEIRISDSFSGSWEVFQRNIGVVLGATVLVYLAMLGANMLPYVSLITGTLLTGPLMGGLWYFYIRLQRGEEATVGDAFAGFSNKFLQLFLVNLVTSIVSFICLLPMFLAMAGVFGAAFMWSQGGNAPPPSEVSALGLVAVVGGFVLSMIAMMILTTSWVYALPLVIDKGLPFWSAMELSRKMVFKHFFSTLLLIIVCGILFTVGVMLCGVGLLFTGPLAFGALVWHYQRIFGDLQPEL